MNALASVGVWALTGQGRSLLAKLPSEAVGMDTGRQEAFSAV